MDKAEIVRILEEMAVILEISEANPFEIMAYRNGARSIEDWEGDLSRAVQENSLTDISGIGKGLAGVITDLVLEGVSSEHRRLLGLFSEKLLDLLKLSGLGPKKIKTLNKELGIDGLDSLEQAAREKRIRSLKGFGPKSEERILAGIERFRRSGTHP